MRLIACALCAVAALAYAPAPRRTASVLRADRRPAARAPARDVTEYLLNFPFEKLMDGSNPVANVGRLQRNYGWFKGDEIELRMRQLLSKTVGPNITFGDLEKRKKTRLRLSATDITAGRHAWLDAETAANVSVASAVRASSAIPFVYPPVVLGGRLFVDGALAAGLAPQRAFQDVEIGCSRNLHGLGLLGQDLSAFSASLSSRRSRRRSHRWRCGMRTPSCSSSS